MNDRIRKKFKQREHHKTYKGYNMYLWEKFIDEILDEIRAEEAEISRGKIV